MRDPLHSARRPYLDQMEGHQAHRIKEMGTMSDAGQNRATRIYGLLLMQTEGPGQTGASACQVGLVVVAEESPQLACWRALVRYAGCRVLATVDITDVVNQQAAMAAQMAAMELDGRHLVDLRLQPATRARLVA